MASNIVNVIVFCKSTNSTLLPWQIAKFHPPSATIRAFFTEVISKKMAQRHDGTVGSIAEVFIGKRKDLLDLVDPDLPIILPLANLSSTTCAIYLLVNLV